MRNILYKVGKHVILAVCCLALVLQPIKSYGATLTYNNLLSTLNSDMGISSFVDVDTFISTYPQFTSFIQEYYSETTYGTNKVIWYSPDVNNTGSDYCIIYSSSTPIVLDSLYGSYYIMSDGSNHKIYTRSSGTSVVQQNSMWVVYPTFNNQTIYATILSPITIFTPEDDYNCTDTVIPNFSIIDNIDPSDPTAVVNGNYPLNIYYQLGLMFSQNFNSYSPNGEVHFNPTWVGVGQFLTYDYLCKTNKSSQNVSLTLSNGSVVSLPNYLYDNPDYTSTLSSISSTLNTINSRVNTTNTRLNTTNSLLNGVNARLDDAFPESQAEMNDAIADQILDDTNDTGLTVNRITSAKSDLDDGLSTFKLDTSGSQYSNPFSALSDADWSFWSQTTLNNLGSGYSYNFEEASLMSETDIYTENQNDLLNLLGW